MLSLAKLLLVFGFIPFIALTKSVVSSLTVVIVKAIGTGPSSANLWIDTSGGTCMRQPTPNSYNDASACSSIQAALSKCEAGDIIRMKAGTYGAQSIAATKTSPGCTVIAETATTIGELTTNGAWYWIEGSLRNFSCSSCSEGFGIYASLDAGGTSTATNVLIDGVIFDKIVNTGTVANHFEVIRVDGNVNGLTIRNSTFTNNVTSSSLIFFSTFRGTKPQNITLENNFFGGLGDAYFTLNMNFQGSGCSNWKMNYNTFQNTMLAGGNCSYNNMIWVGNLGPRGNCEGTAFRSNVWFGDSGAACGATDRTVASAGLGGVDGFHLTAGSPVIDAGGIGADCISIDHDKNSRPAGDRCDAGAHEYGASLTN